ncbi:putative RNA-binding protein Luc7-like 1 [Halotydeus destructor]|nr:putative RNA-binding protein Luc7-like 1 [Halotydeus destructor]
MSATDQMRAMLDQLMGTQRDGANNKRHQYHFTDSRVCKSFLLDCCPHDVLASTRMDIGDCSKVHDLALRADYGAGSATREYGYELDAFDHLTAFVAEADRKTELAKKRLCETQEELSQEVSEKLERVHELAEQIGKKLAAAEKAGEDGDVEESMKIMEEVENTKKEKTAAEMEYRNSMPASSYQQQKLRVCEVCSAYLGIHDNDRRLADHFGGKLHLGFITIRERLEELRAICEEKRAKGLFEERYTDVGQRQGGNQRRGAREDRYHNRRYDGGDRSGAGGREVERRRRSRSNSPEKDRRRRRSRSPRNVEQNRHRRSRSPSSRDRERYRRKDDRQNRDFER